MKDKIAEAAFKTVKDWMEFSKLCLPEGDPPDGTIMKMDRKEGSCEYGCNFIDSEVIAMLPEKAKAAIPNYPDDKTLLFLEFIQPGHVRLFARMLQLNPKYGRWIYWTCKVDPSEALHSPDGLSARTFRRVMAVMAGVACGIDRQAWRRFIANNTP